MISQTPWSIFSLRASVCCAVLCSLPTSLFSCTAYEMSRITKMTLSLLTYTVSVIVIYGINPIEFIHAYLIHFWDINILWGVMALRVPSSPASLHRVVSAVVAGQGGNRSVRGATRYILWRPGVITFLIIKHAKIRNKQLTMTCPRPGWLVAAVSKAY